MPPKPQPVSLSLKSLYFGGGSIAILILEITAIAYGLSDGSLIFIAPLLISPILGIISIVLGIMALKRKSQLRTWATLGIICGSLCVLLFTWVAVYVMILASALQGVF